MTQTLTDTTTPDQIVIPVTDGDQTLQAAWDNLTGEMKGARRLFAGNHGEWEERVSAARRALRNGEPFTIGMVVALYIDIKARNADAARYDEYDAVDAADGSDELLAAFKAADARYAARIGAIKRQTGVSVKG
jgi:hypothetical protein